ncbi:MAG: hypothetical protein K8S94_02295, partial [Planctomycetia bacterium]|nr:hypothetical protein [Planctomycetia bacterium]
MVWTIFSRTWLRRRPALRALRKQRAQRRSDRWTRFFGSEPLELRRLMAAFTYDSVNDRLSIDLNTSSEQLTLTSSGDGNYVFTSSGTFTGTNESGLSGAGTNTLTITSSLALTDVAIGDSAAGTKVTFGSNTGSYVDNFEITLDATAAAASLALSADTSFSTASLTATVDYGISLTANLSATSGSLSLTSTAGAITLSASKSITTTTAGDITLSASGAITNIASVTSITAAGNVSIDATGALNLPAITSGGTLEVQATGGLTQAAAINAGGDSFFGGASVTLSNATNNFQGAVSAQSSSSGNITLVDSGDLQLGAISQASNRAGSLNVTAGGSITQAASTTIVTGTGAITFTAGSGKNILIGNTGNQLSNATTTFKASSGNLADLTITDITAFTIQPDLAITGDLAITAGGAITDAGNVAVGGAAAFTTTAANGAITLDGTSTYGGALSVSTHGTGNATVTNVVGDLDLGASTVGGRFVASVAGNITDSGPVAVTGTTAITTTANNGSVVLNEPGSKFTGAVNVTTNGSGSTTLTGLQTAINLGNVTTNNLTISATGAITDSGVLNVSGASSFTTTALGSSITINNPGSSFVGPIKAAADGAGSVTISGFTNDIALGQVTFGTSLTVSTTGNISVTPSSNLTSTGFGLGSIALTSTAGNITLNSTLATSGGGLTLTAATGIAGDANGILSSVAPINTGLASGGIVLNVTGTGNVSIGGHINARGANSNMSQGGQGGAVQITTSDGTIAVMAIDTFGGDATPGAGKVNGGNGGLISIDANTGVSPTSAGTISIGGDFNSAGGTGNDGNPQGPGGNILIYDNVILTNSVTLATGATTGNIFFNKRIDSDATPRALTLVAGEGGMEMNGAAGDSQPLLSLTSTSTGGIIRQNIATVGSGGISVSAGAGLTIGGQGTTVNFNTIANGTPAQNGPVYLSATTTTVDDDFVITRGNGAVTFTKYLTGVGTPNLTITTNGTVAPNRYGDVNFGDSATGLGNITMTNVDDLTASSSGGASGTSISAQSLVYTNRGTGNVSFTGSQSYSAVGGVNVETYGSVSIGSSVTTSATGAPIKFFAETLPLTIAGTYGNINTVNGVVELTGKGVNQGSQISVNAGNETILLDGQGTTIVLSGTLTTSSASNTAILIRDASTVSLRGTNVPNGQLQIGTPGISPADVTGDVSQSNEYGVGVIAKYVSANTGGNITIYSAYNQIENLRTFKLGGALAINDSSGGLNVLEDLTATSIDLATNGGALNISTSNITSTAGNIILRGAGVTQATGSNVSSGSGTIFLSGAPYNGGSGNVSLAGTLHSTNNNTCSAIDIRNAWPLQLGDIRVLDGGISIQPIEGWLAPVGPVTQAAGTVIKARNLSVRAAGSVTLTNDNEIDFVGSTCLDTLADGTINIRDVTGNLTLARDVTTANYGSSITLNATGGTLDLAGYNVRGTGVSLLGVGVKSTGGTIGIYGNILVDANDGAIDLTGSSITTTSTSSTAVQLIDSAFSVVLGSITTGTGGTLVLGGSGGDVLGGNVSQGSGSINVGTVTGNANGSVILDKTGNVVTTLSNLTAGGAITLYDSDAGLAVTGVVTNGDKGLINLTTQTTLSLTGSLNGSGATLRALDLGLGQVTLAGDVTANTGNVTLVAAAKTVTQTAGIISTTGSVTGSAYSGLTLNQNNTIGGLGPYTVDVTGNISVNDVSGGLNLTGDVKVVASGTVTITTAGGPLNLSTYDVTTSGNVTLTGVGINQSAGSLVDATGSLIAIDANGGPIAMTGNLTTTSPLATALVIRDATTAALGNISVTSGTVTIGVSKDITGAVTQSVGTTIAAQNLTISANDSVTLDSAGNAIDNLLAVSTGGNFTLVDGSGGLIFKGNTTSGGGVTITTAEQALSLGIYDIAASGDVSLTGFGIIQGTSASDIDAGGGNITLTGLGDQFVLPGTIKTTSNSSLAVLIQNGTNLQFNSIVTGANGTTTFGGAGANGLDGTVTQTLKSSILQTGTLVGNSGQVALSNANNTLAFLGPYTSSDAFALNDSTGGITFSGDVTTGGTTTITTPGNLSMGIYDLLATGSQVTLTGVNVTQDSTFGRVLAATTLVAAGSGIIDLASAANDFTGRVTLMATGAYASIRDANNLLLDNLSGNIGPNTSIKAVAGGTLSLATEPLNTGTGYIWLESQGGNLQPTGSLTTSTGNIDLRARDNLQVYFAVESTSAGNITLVGGSIDQTGNADLTTTGAGTISVTADGTGSRGNITMVPGTVYSTGSGDITLSAATFIDVGKVVTTGNITATATSGAITDVWTGDEANFNGSVVALSAGSGIGTSGDPIETDSNVLRATTGTGGIFINELG